MGEHQMKVNASTDSMRPDPATGKAVAKGAATAVAGNSDTATVRLSGVSASLAAGDSGPAFDASKVASITQAIREGRFEVDSGVVADKLIANVNELFGKVH